MAKRKRGSGAKLQDKLEEHDVSIFRALKVAKGFERQRQSKRVRGTSATPDKQARIEKEISMLKSVDLHQVASVHLRSALLKVGPVAALTETADELRAGIPKAELPAEDKAAFNNVSSALCNHKPVKQAVAAAVKAICEFLNVQPNAKGKQDKKQKKTKTEEKEEAADGEPKPKARKKVAVEEEDVAMEDGGETDDDSEFEGFESDVDEPGPAVGELDSEAEAAEEAEYNKFDGLLGSSSEDEDDAGREELYRRFKGRETVNLDDISLSGSAADSESEEEEEEEDKEDLSESSKSASLPPAKKVKESKSKTKKAKKIGPIRDSTFLPSLMGGYISGSESASDIDVAPPKKRLGQRSRQAIYEKKFGARANHLRKEKANGGGGRDDGWDMRRGAVEAGDQGRRGPWKKGITNPTAHGHGHGHGNSNSRGPAVRENTVKQEPRPTKRDDEGTLHPSWQAAKKAKEQKSAQFSGQKIVFD